MSAWLASANISLTLENLMCANVTLTWGNCVRKCICLPGKIVRTNAPHSFKNVRKYAAIEIITYIY